MRGAGCSRKQESPPAGNRKRRTARGITCPSISYRGGGVPTLAGWGGAYLGWGVTYLAVPPS